MAPRTRSEILFEEYLERLKIAYEVELQVDGTTSRPDYWIRSQCDQQFAVVCEVSQIEKQLDTSQSPWYDGAIPFPNKVKKKQRQGRGLIEMGLPYVVVIDQGLWPGHPTNLMTTLFGQHRHDYENDGAWSHQPGLLSESRYTHLSAVAIMKEFNPKKRVLQREVERRLGESERSLAEIWKASEQAIQALSQNGQYEVDGIAVALTWVKNPYATVQLPIGYPAGRFDTWWDRSIYENSPVLHGVDVRATWLQDVS